MRTSCERRRKRGKRKRTVCHPLTLLTLELRGRCAHSGSPNGLDSIRQLFVARFHSTTHGEAMLTDDGGVSSDGNLWKYWGPAVNNGAAGGGVSKL